MSDLRHRADGPEVVGVLRGLRVNLSTEALAQADIETALKAHFLDRVVEREVRLSATDRVDFMVDGVAIEVKVRASAARGLVSQIERYARHERVTSIVVATAKATSLPACVGGKLVYLVNLSRGWM
jgi:hypothetical protein